jgi:hypothetical protein
MIDGINNIGKADYDRPHRGPTATDEGYEHER